MQELKRCVKELGFPGVEIGSHVNEWNLDAPELQSIFAVSVVLVITVLYICHFDRQQKNLVLVFLYIPGTWSKVVECQNFGCHGW